MLPSWPCSTQRQSQTEPLLRIREPWHFHRKGTHDEVWVLDEGEASLTAGDRPLSARPGSIVIVPAGMPHKFTNTGTISLRMVCIHTSARMETEWLEEARHDA